jgi:O-antigen/teichoic acid export membrane protein
LKGRFIKNAVSNLGRGTAGAIVALLLPPVLIRHMPAASYAVWVLILQIAAYVGYLDFGLQMAIGRYVAFANEKNDPGLRNSIFSTAFAGLSFAACVGFTLIIGFALASRRIFPSIPPPYVMPMRIALLIVGISTALGLPASAWNGVFVGLERFDIPAATTVSAKFLSALGLIWAALTGRSLLVMALVVCVANVFSYILQFGLLRRVAPGVRFQTKLITKAIVRELAGYSFSLTVWSFSMLLISGFDLLIVGRFEFAAVTPYSVAITLIGFLAGVQTAIFGVIMPHAAQLHAQQNSAGLGRLLLKMTKLGVLLLLLTGLPLIVFAGLIIKVWIGAQFVQSGRRILAVLAIANIIRLTGSPFASILVGTGQQRLVVFSPLMEGVTNLVFSILLGLRYGAIGVAWGTLIGAIAAVLANIFYNLPRTRQTIDCSALRYASEAIFLPALCAIPASLALAMATVSHSVGAAVVTSGWLLSFGACAIFILKTSAKDLWSDWLARGHRDAQ